MTDLLMLQTVDGGEIEIVNGREMLTTTGLETAGYLSLFGGNLDDAGGEADIANQWWANFSEPDPAAVMRSETAALLQSLPLVPANLKLLQEAAGRDLAWFKDRGIAQEIAIRVSLPARNTLKVEVLLTIDGTVVPFEFVESST